MNYKRFSSRLLLLTLLSILFLNVGGISRIEATYITKYYTTDVELYSPLETYPSTSALQVMLTRIAQDYPTWYRDYDYSISYSTSTVTRIRLVQKTDSRLRNYIGLVNVDTTKDIDRWDLVIATGSVNTLNYRFTTSNGAYIDRVINTNSHTIDTTASLYYTNFPIMSYLSHITSVPITDTTLIEATWVEKRQIPLFILQQLGYVTQDTADIIDNNNQNTDRLVNHLTGVFQGVGQVITDVGNFILDSIDSFRNTITNTVTSITTPIVNGISSALNTIITPIVNGIRDLFLPSDTFISNWYNNVKTLWLNKLGFLAQTVQIIVDLFNRILTGSTQHTINFGKLFNADFIINFNAIESNIPQLWTFSTVLIRGSIVLFMVQNIFKKVLTVLRT